MRPRLFKKLRNRQNIIPLSSFFHTGWIASKMRKPKILVTGGLGFIGSHTIIELIGSGFDVISLDNEMNSSAEVLKGIEIITKKKVVNIHVDLSNTAESLDEVKKHGSFDGIIH